VQVQVDLRWARCTRSPQPVSVGHKGRMPGSFEKLGTCRHCQPPASRHERVQTSPLTRCYDALVATHTRGRGLAPMVRSELGADPSSRGPNDVAPRSLLHALSYAGVASHSYQSLRAALYREPLARTSAGIHDNPASRVRLTGRSCLRHSTDDVARGQLARQAVTRVLGMGSRSQADRWTMRRTRACGCRSDPPRTPSGNARELHLLSLGIAPEPAAPRSS